MSSTRATIRLSTIPGFLLASLVLLLAATLVASQSSDAPVGPISTDNAQSACVQYGDCTALPSANTYTTATQLSPVSPPASTTATAGPTNAAESEASQSDLASTGAAAAYSQLSAEGSIGSVVSAGLPSVTGSIAVVTTYGSSGSSSDASSNAAQGRGFGRTFGGLYTAGSDLKVVAVMASLFITLLGLLVVL